MCVERTAAASPPWVHGDGIPGPHDCVSCGLSSCGTGGLRQCYIRAHADRLHTAESSGHAAAHFRQAGKGMHASKTCPSTSFALLPLLGWRVGGEMEPTCHHRGHLLSQGLKTCLCDWEG